MTSRATTSTIGSLFGPEEVVEHPDRQRLLARPDREQGHDDLVERQSEGEQRAGGQRRAHRRDRDEAERLPRVGAQIGGGLLDRSRRAAKAGDDVVVDDDDAEGGVPHDHGEQAEADAQHLGERVGESDAGHDAGQRDRQHYEERDRLATEEAMPRHGQRGEGAEQERDRGRRHSRLQGEYEGVAEGGVVERRAEPMRRQPRRWPLEDVRGVERIERDHRKRDVDERQRHAHAHPEQHGCPTRKPQ